MKRLLLIPLIALANCGPDGVSALLADAGRALEDAAAALRDASDATRSDARAQVDDALELACGVESKRTDGSTQASQYFAELAVDTSSIRGVDVRLCEREVFGRDPVVPACEGSCSGASRPPVAPCQTGSIVELEPGTLRVFCGSRSVSSNGESGYRFNAIKVWVRR